MTKSIFVVCFAFSCRYSPQIGSPHQNTMQTLPTSNLVDQGILLWFLTGMWVSRRDSNTSLIPAGDSSQRLET